MIGIALLGAGRMGRVHTQAISAAGAKVVAIYDAIPTVAEKLATEVGAIACGSAEEAMGYSSVGAVVIATSSDTHVEYLIKAVTLGIPVMCEKPIAPTLVEARRCIATIGLERAKSVFLAFNRRFDRGHSAVREAVLAGQIGRLEQLTITSRDPFPPPLDYVSRSGGLFRDMMIHDFDTARSILQEEPVTLTAQGSSIIEPEIGKLGDVDTAVVTMATATGKLAVILNSRRCAFGFDQRIEAFGSDGMALSDNPLRSGVRYFTKEHPGAPDLIREFFLDRYGESYKLEVESFLAHAASGAPMPINAIDGLRAAYLAEAATSSLATGMPVQLTSIEQEF